MWGDEIKLRRVTLEDLSNPAGNLSDPVDLSEEMLERIQERIIRWDEGRIIIDSPATYIPKRCY